MRATLGGGPRAPVAPPPNGKACYKVTTQSKKKDEIGLQTLIGDYEERGTNHGKKYFQKTQKIEGHEDVKVFLYYWDNRDGPEFAGWWFGDQVGGSQVWARSNSHGTTPPKAGWKVPWDAVVAEPGVLVVDPMVGGGPVATRPALVQPSAAAARPPAGTGAAQLRPGTTPVAAPAWSGAQPATLKARVAGATAKVEEIETAVQSVLATAKGLSAASDEQLLKTCSEELFKQQRALVEVQKSLTQDITEARKGGPTAMASVTELSKLSPRLRTLQTGLTAEVAKIRQLQTKVSAGAAVAKKQAETAAATKMAEERDAKELQEALPPTREIVNTAEDSVDAIIMMAAPLIQDPPDDDGDILNNAMQEIEIAATDAQTKITEARAMINAKLQGARKFAPETRKTALSEFSSMQQKLTESQKKLNPYKTFKKEFRNRVQARKSLQELNDKLSAQELEVEKVKMMSSSAESAQMSEDEISSAEKLIQPAKAAIEQVARTVEQKLRGADGAMREELNSMQTKIKAVKTDLEAVVAVLGKQRQSMATSEMLKSASEKVDSAETALAKCQEAEMPFLKGIEVLPGDESTKAISDCEKAASVAQSAVNQAASFLRAKQGEAKRLVPELAASVAEELTAHQKRLEVVTKKVSDFKKETGERKMAALLAEVIEGVGACEKKIEAFTQAGKVFSSDSLESVSAAELQESLEKSNAAEKEASASMLEVRKTFTTKQKEAKGQEAVQALNKLKARINTAQEDLAKTKKLVASGERIIKGKAVLVEEDEKVRKVETAVKEAERKLKPGEEETALGIEEAKVSDAEVEEMAKLFGDGQVALKASLRTVEANAANAPASLKAPFQKLTERCKIALSTVSELMGITKDQRERVMSEAYVREGKEKVAEVDACIEKVNEAELPFLKGIEVLALKEAHATIAESEAAAQAVQLAVSAARTFIASKNLEVRKFGEVAAKPAQEAFQQLTERVNAASAKLGSFKKETEGRKKTALMQEASEKVTTAEAAVKKMAEVAEPFAQEGEHSEEECMRLVGQLKESAALLVEASNFLAARHKDVSGNAGHTTTLKELQGKIREAQHEMAKYKKLTTVHEAKYTAKKVVADAVEKVDGLEAEIKRATEYAAPLLEQGGTRFLVDVCLHMLTSVLNDYMGEKSLSVEDVFREFCGGSDTMSKDAFLAHIQKLREALGREELDFLPERREAMFEQLDSDKDGSVSLADFKAAFVQTFHCIKEITLTDVFEVTKSKTLAKLEAGTELKTSNNPRTDESGLTRVEVTVPDGKTGWVTLHGNQGTKFVEPFTTFHIFCKDVEMTLAGATKCITEVQTWLSGVMKELGTPVKDSPLAEARTELHKLKTKVTTMQEGFNKIRHRFAVAKKDHHKNEAAERNAHVERRESKEADTVTAPAAAKVEAVEALVTSLLENSKTLRELNVKDAASFATPLSTLEAFEKGNEALTKLIEEARAAVKEQTELLPKTLTRAMTEAKRDLTKMNARLESSKRQAQGGLVAVRKKMQVIVDALIPEVSALLRKQAQDKGIDAEALFTQIVAPGEEKISEDGFCSYVSGLAGSSFNSEHLLLLVRHVEQGGISRRRFQALAQQFFVVVKGIAITDSFDIGTAKTLRKAEVDEVIELIEGPQSDAKVGVVRIRGRSLADGKEGWISLKGNQGTPFLREVEKPFYRSEAEVALEREFKGEHGADIIRTVSVGEILELIEGPRKVSYEPGLRVKGKAVSDGVLGWFSARDKNGTVFAEADTKYYVCTASVAMTDKLDIKDCKVVRKLASGELFTVEEGPTKGEESGITRVRGKAMKDDSVGWITIKGNAGTVYAEPSSKHYCILQDVPLTKKFPSASPGEEVRVLAKGEAMQVLEGPKEEVFAPETRIKVKTSDGTMGWITMKKSTLKPWTPSDATPEPARSGEASKAQE